MNLIEERWIPVRRQSGKDERIAPWELTDDFEQDPVVALAAPRPDFQGGLMQFLIGLLQTAAPPDEEKGLEWEDWLEDPPNSEVLWAAFAPYVDCFDLDGDGPRFMQDLELKDGKVEPVSVLLIDSPGKNTLKNNADHFVKRGRIRGMCYSCTATALFTLQINAPSGGQGHRTSLRGGGPLTTLVVIDPMGSDFEDNTLWHNIWLNILDRRGQKDAARRNEQERTGIFPWLEKTRTSAPNTGQDTYFGHVHALQMYWSMPRRIRLDFGHTSEGVCDICTTSNTALVAHFLAKPHGINYAGSWRHPLSPHWIDEKGKPSPLHPQAGGFTYRHWGDWVEKSDSRRPAQVIEEFKNRIQREEQFRLWVFGYDMDNMKPRNWYEAVFPLYLFPGEEKRQVFSDRLGEKVEASEMVAGYVRGCVKDAWFSRPGDTRGDMAFVTESFFSETEDAFFNSVRMLYEELKEMGEGLAALEHWYSVLNRSAQILFEEYAAREEVAFANMKRVVKARQKLLKMLKGKKLREKLHIPVRRKEKAV